MGKSGSCKLTQEKYEEIMSLPKRTFTVGGTTLTGLFDENTQEFYYLDKDGNWTGKVGVAQFKSAPPEPEGDDGSDVTDDEAEMMTDDTTATADSLESDNANNEDSESEFSAPPKKHHKAIIIGALVLVGLAGCYLCFEKNVGQKPAPALPSSAAQQNEALNNIDVIQVTTDLIPGDMISEKNTTNTSVSAETYNQIVLGGTNIYQWSREPALLGKYVTEYIPKGQYLAYNNVASVYSVPDNPWCGEADGMKLVPAPYPAAKDDSTTQLNYGSVVDITIQRKTVSQTPETGAAAENENPVEGLQHETSVQQSVIVDTYKLSGITVCDLLDADKKSIYQTYASLMAIPAGEQLTYIQSHLTDADFSSSIVPTYLTLKLSTAQSEALGDLLSTDYIVTYTVRDDKNADNDAKSTFAANAQALADTISKAKTNANTQNDNNGKNGTSNG